MSSPEWFRFKVGTPSTHPRWTEPTCQELSTVSHVAHVGTAMRIVEDHVIRAGLIQDKSKLNTSRILVSWLSPNDWGGAGGFRYGNVRFKYDWRSLVQGKNCYWVESIAYGVAACRILLTENSHASLTPYDPTRGDGPWYLDVSTGTHYWNGRYCLELMLEENLPLANVSEIDFVDHHPHGCCIDPSSCPDRGKGSSESGAEFMGKLIAHGTALPEGFLVSHALRNAAWALAGYANRAKKVSPAGQVQSSTALAKTLARAAVGHAARREEDELKQLASTFKSHDEFADSFRAVLAEAAGDSDLLE
jgi:hypothetical protein